MIIYEFFNNILKSANAPNDSTKFPERLLPPETCLPALTASETTFRLARRCFHFSFSFSEVARSDSERRLRTFHEIVLQLQTIVDQCDWIARTTSGPDRPSKLCGRAAGSGNSATVHDIAAEWTGSSFVLRQFPNYYHRRPLQGRIIPGRLVGETSFEGQRSSEWRLWNFQMNVLAITIIERIE
jgi:hypothetical protein